MKNIGSYPSIRLRRNRKTDWSRRLVRESNLSAKNIASSDTLFVSTKEAEAIKLFKNTF